MCLIGGGIYLASINLFGMFDSLLVATHGWSVWATVLPSRREGGLMFALTYVCLLLGAACVPPPSGVQLAVAVALVRHKSNGCDWPSALLKAQPCVSANTSGRNCCFAYLRIR